MVDFRTRVAGWFWPGLLLLTGLPTALLLAFAVPLGHVPDERYHVLRADSLLYGVVIGHRQSLDGHPAAGVLADPAMTSVITLPERPDDLSPQPMNDAMAARARAVPWNINPVFVRDEAMAGYQPLPYLPAAVAIAGVRMAGGSPFAAFHAARLANLMAFFLIGVLSLGVTRSGHAVMATVLLLPMTLSLAASCSQDGLLIACTALACACLTRAADRLAGPRWAARASMLLAVVIASKPPYAPLALLLLVPLRRPLTMRLLLSALPLLAAGVWTIAELHWAAVPPWRGPALAGPFWPGPRTASFEGPDFSAQLSVLASSPSLSVTLPIRAMLGGSNWLLHQAIGVLDYLCIVLPRGLYAVWFLALPAAIAADCLASQGMAGLRHRDRVFVAALIATTAFAISLALYVQWTPVGMPWIAGLQGRYFLPLALALSIAVPGLGGSRLELGLSFVPAAAALCDLVWLPRIVAAFYAPA